MNKLPLKTRALILNMLCEGQSMRATARLAEVSFNTVAKLLIDGGKACAELHDELVQASLPTASSAMRYGASPTRSKRMSRRQRPHP